MASQSFTSISEATFKFSCCMVNRKFECTLDWMEESHKSIFPSRPFFSLSFFPSLVLMTKKGGLVASPVNHGPEWNTTCKTSCRHFRVMFANKIFSSKLALD